MKLIHSKKINNVELLATSFFTLLAIYNNQITVFYILYLFWWNEVLFTVVAYGYKKQRGFPLELGNKVFLLSIYLFFIILFFGFIAHYKNYDLMALNFEVLFFKNLFFNFNLLFFLIEMIWFFKQNPSKVQSCSIDAFSSRTIVLHISIILGAFIMLLIVPSFPNLFSSENNWSSVIIVLPFLLLRYLFQRNGLL